eukprot:1152316-Pelagomonas_calceolata.AAC.6
MHDLVVATLQEGGVDGAEGHQALARQPCSKGHSVLLGNADIKHAVRELVLKPAEGMGGKEATFDFSMCQGNEQRHWAQMRASTRAHAHTQTHTHTQSKQPLLHGGRTRARPLLLTSLISQTRRPRTVTAKNEDLSHFQNPEPRSFIRHALSWAVENGCLQILTWSGPCRQPWQRGWP